MERQELLRFARLGAQARLETLQREMGDLLRKFPGLSAAESPAPRKPGRPRKRQPVTAVAAVTPAAAEPAAAAPGRRMSPAARKRISDAAKKRWTEWRKKNKR